MFLAFNLEHLQQSQNWNRTILEYPFCIPSKRLVFWREKGGRLESRDHAEFASAVIYVGRSIKRFANAFENIGTIIIPRITNKKKRATQQSTEIEERYGIHCAIDADPDIDMPLQESQP